MWIKVTKSELKEVAKLVKGFGDVNVLIRTIYDGDVYFETSALDLMVRYKSKDTKIIEYGKTVMPTSMLNTLVNDDVEEFIIIEHGGGCKIEAGDNTYTRQEPPICKDSFIDDVEKSNKFEKFLQLNFTDFKKVVKNALRIVPKKNSGRYQFGDVLLSKKEGLNALDLVTTDGHQLLVQEVAYKNQQGFAGELFLSGKLLRKVAKLKGDEVSIKYDTCTVVSVGNVELYGSNCDGNFPKYQEVIPDDDDIEQVVICDRKTLEAKLKQIVKGKIEKINLEWDKNKLAVSSCPNSENETSYKFNISIKETGKGKICLNPAYLLSGIRAFSDCKMIKINFIGDTCPIKIVPEVLGASEDQEAGIVETDNKGKHVYVLAAIRPE